MRRSKHVADVERVPSSPKLWHFCTHYPHRGGRYIDSIHARHVVILVFVHSLDSPLIRLFFFFFFCITWPCLSFYDKLNFLFRTRQTKGFARFFFAVRSPFWEESCYLACKLRCIPAVNGTMCKFLSPGRSRDDREWVSILRILRKLFYACE